jgi:large subunit ribosomal protein L1
MRSGALSRSEWNVKEMNDSCVGCRYLRAFEVGSAPLLKKYEVAVKIRAIKNTKVIKNRIRLPHSVGTDNRIAVICPENSEAAREAVNNGAVAVGEESLFQSIRDGKINFNKLLCVPGSVPALNKAGLGKILGPKGLMPSPKTKTITSDLGKAMRDITGAVDFREKLGVVRMAIGKMNFTPEQVGANLKVFMEAVKQGIVDLEDETPKELQEVVLSSTHGPGFPLNGSFKSSDDKITPGMLSGLM